ncbi:MAG TPA: hypothetical protein VFQ53_08005 [Kofleriaceae bacterium]|nr:hypothetical protein [Kofleriaceae bacterium]
MLRSILPALFAATLAGGCYATTSGGVAYSGSVTATTVAPDLVYVGPGVQVIADYDEPIFYSDGFYWRYYGNTWYRSSYYTGGWVYASPPRAVLSINSPHTYVRYRPNGWRPRNGGYRNDGAYVRDHRDSPPVYRDDRPVVRDHRDPAPPVYRDDRPVVRDHRDPGPPVYQQPQRDNRPVERDHRDNAPVERDHRDNRPVERDHRDNKPTVPVRDHR